MTQRFNTTKSLKSTKMKKNIFQQKVNYLFIESLS